MAVTRPLCIRLKAVERVSSGKFFYRWRIAFTTGANSCVARAQLLDDRAIEIARRDGFLEHERVARDDVFVCSRASRDQHHRKAWKAVPHDAAKVESRHVGHADVRYDDPN